MVEKIRFNIPRGVTQVTPVLRTRAPMRLKEFVVLVQGTREDNVDAEILSGAAWSTNYRSTFFYAPVAEGSGAVRAEQLTLSAATITVTLTPLRFGDQDRAPEHPITDIMLSSEVLGQPTSIRGTVLRGD